PQPPDGLGHLLPENQKGQKPGGHGDPGGYSYQKNIVGHVVVLLFALGLRVRSRAISTMEGMRKISFPQIKRQHKVEITPTMAGKCSLWDSHCSTNKVTNRAVRTKDTPSKLTGT